jgi:uncharacterized membrane protein
MEQLARWLMPLTIVTGFLTAGYLAYVEITLADAACSVMGDCNTVRQSSYAHILGIPIAVIGILGYLVILALWLANQYKGQRLIDAALFAIARRGWIFDLSHLPGALCDWGELRLVSALGYCDRPLAVDNCHRRMEGGIGHAALR